MVEKALTVKPWQINITFVCRLSCKVNDERVELYVITEHTLTKESMVSVMASTGLLLLHRIYVCANIGT